MFIIKSRKGLALLVNICNLLLYTSERKCLYKWTENELVNFPVTYNIGFNVCCWRSQANEHIKWLLDRQEVLRRKLFEKLLVRPWRKNMFRGFGNGEFKSEVKIKEIKKSNGKWNFYIAFGRIWTQSSFVPRILN